MHAFLSLLYVGAAETTHSDVETVSQLNGNEMDKDLNNVNAQTGTRYGNLILTTQ